MRYVSVSEAVKRDAIAAVFGETSNGRGSKHARVDLTSRDSWRCHPDLNRGMTVLQTVALPLGYGTEAHGIYLGNGGVRNVDASALVVGVVGVGGEAEGPGDGVAAGAHAGRDAEEVAAARAVGLWRGVGELDRDPRVVVVAVADAKEAARVAGAIEILVEDLGVGVGEHAVRVAPLVALDQYAADFGVALGADRVDRRR